MVCDRCVRVVREELGKIGLDVRSVSLGEAIVAGEASSLDKEGIRAALVGNGFELIEDRRVRTVERIKLAILRLVQGDEDDQSRKLALSHHIAREVGQEYHTLSSIFSSIEGTTIEHYTILQRIERAKELLKYGELTLSEISYKLGYSSVQHLSAQFKKVTGMTPSRFKKIVENMRKPVDLVHSIGRRHGG
jgi:AraC-like DNA-binding protein